MERVRFIFHRNKRVLLIDHTNSTAEEILATLAEVERIVTSQPPKSLLTLSDFSGAKVDKAAGDRMKVVAAKEKPYVRCATLIGAERSRRLLPRPAIVLGAAVSQIPDSRGGAGLASERERGERGR